MTKALDWKKDDGDRRMEDRREDDKKPSPPALPPFGIPLLVLALTLAIGSATYNFLSLEGRFDKHEIMSNSEFESLHLYKQKTDIEMSLLKQSMAKADTDRENTLNYLRALAYKSGVRIKEKE